MTVEDCYQLGYIVKPHGLKGEVQVFLDVDDPREYRTLESVFVLQGQALVPFFLESISVNADKGIAKFEEIDTIDDAKSLKGLELYMPLDTLPDLEEGEYFVHELEGFEISDVTLGVVGSVTGVMDAGAQRLISVEHSSGKEILIPFSDELVMSMDNEKRQIFMNLPEGLVELYLND